MSDVLLLYLFTRVNIVLGLCWLAALASAVLAIAATIERYDCFPGDGKWPGFTRAAVAGLCISIPLVVLVPGQQSLAIIVGGKIALDAARSDEAKEISGLVLDAVRRTLKEKE